MTGESTLSSPSDPRISLFLFFLFFFITHFFFSVTGPSNIVLQTKQAADLGHPQTTVPCVARGHRKKSKEEVNSQSKGRNFNGYEVSV